MPNTFNEVTFKGLNFTNARQLTRSLGFTTRDEYRQRYRESAHLCRNPDKIFRDEWTHWGDYLGTRKQHRLLRDRQTCQPYRRYSEFVEAVERLQMTHHFTTRAGYFEHYHKDDRLPRHPERVYSHCFKSWRHLLVGKQPSLYETFAISKMKARMYQFKNSTHYRQHAKIVDLALPTKPEKKFPREWQGWSDYLGL